MALEANLAVSPIPEVSGFEAPRMGVYLPARMALDANIPFRVARCTRLQIPPGLQCVFRSSCRRIPLPVRSEHHVRLDPQASCRETAVAIVAVPLVVAALAGLRVVLGLDRVDTDEIAAVTLGNIIQPCSISFELGVYPTARMAVETERLLVALSAIMTGATRHVTMSPNPVGTMVGCHSFGFVAGVALGQIHFRIILVGLLLSQSLLDIKNGKYADEY